MPPNQQPQNYDFTQQGGQPQPPAQQPPQQPVQPQPDPAISQLQNDIAEIKTALTGGNQQPQNQPASAEPPSQPPAQRYDDWGVVFQDVDKRAEAIVEQKLAEMTQRQTQAQAAAQEQEQKNQQYIDNTVNQLRGAGLLPPIGNQFDQNDQGKQAESELLGYAISLGSTDLISAAKELQFRHQAGYKFDYQSKQFVQTTQPNTQDPNGAMFGNLPQQPDQPAPQQFPQNFGQQPQQSAPYGPQNPYMQPPQQYPAGFNAPVSSGNSYQGTQGGAPALKNIRNSSYDALVEQFNRTQ